MPSGFPEPYDEPGEAQAFYALKRAPVGSTAIPTERYLVAAQRMKGMRRYSTRLGRFLPRGGTDASAMAGALGTWAPLGPGNIGGRTRAIVIDPGTPATMYAGGVAGGVWKTTNGGASWAPLDDFMANLAVSSLAMEPGNSSVLYAGTGEGYFNIDAVRGAGIFKTTNAGVTWTQLPNTNTSNFFYVNDLIVTSGGQRVYAATRTGVWRSLDGGTTWAPLSVASVPNGCLDLALRPGGPPDILFASCGTFAQATIYRNPDAGGAGTFVAVHSQAFMGRTSLAIAPSNPNVMYALSASIDGASPFNNGLHAVFRSTDGGLNWTARVTNASAVKLNRLLLSNPIFASFSDCFGSTDQLLNQGWYDNVIAVDPLDENRVWVGGTDLFRSDDGGANWGVASYWWGSPSPQFAHADQHAIVFDPGYNGTTNKRMFVGNDGGLFRTDDARAPTAVPPFGVCDPSFGGVTWTERNNNYGVTQFYYGVPYPGGATYFGGTQDNGTDRGTDGGGSEAWTGILGGDGGAVAVDPTNTQVLYAENTGLSIQKSTNGGVAWASATTGIAGDNGFLFIAPFVMDPGNPQRLWAGGRFMWRTTNGATSWSQGSSVIEPTPNSVSAIAVSPANANSVLAGTTGGAIHRTSIGLTSGAGTAWPAVTPRAGYVSSVAFHPTNALVAYATYSTFGGVHVWKTINGGTSWTDADGTGATGIPDLPCHSIVVDPGSPSQLYVGTDLGVFVSTDDGATWAVENTGFANVVTESLALDATSRNLFAFTHGRGAFKVPASLPPTVSVNDVTLAEGDTGTTSFVFTVTLSSTPAVDVTVDYATANGTAAAGVDYTAVSGTLTFPAGGALSQTVTVPVLGDTMDEPDETFFLNLTNPTGGATFLDGQGQGTILNEDPPPSVSIDDAFVVEGDSGPTTATFTVSLSAPSGWTITVPYATANGTAQAPADYMAASGAVTFVPGTVAQPVTVTVNGDLVPEPDETFLVNLSAPAAHATLDDAQGVGTIRDDDAVPADDVRFFTTTATDGQNFLEWLNPGLPYVSTVIHRTAATSAAACVYPTSATNPATFVAEVAGTAGQPGSYADPTVLNDTTYCYTAFVKTATTPTFSAGRNAHGRPFDTTGPVKWAYTTGATAVTAPGVGIVATFAVSNDRILHAMERGLGPTGGHWPTGWRPLVVGGPVQSRPPIVPRSSGRVVLLGSQDGFAYAADVDTGSLVWQSEIPLGAELQAAVAGYFSSFGGAFDVALAGGRSPGFDNVFYGLDLADGKVLWQYPGEPGDRIGVINGEATVSYLTRRVYFASRERSPGTSTLWCLDFTASGATLKWKRALGSIDGSPVLRGDAIYVGTNAGLVYALDATTGSTRWSFPTGVDGPVKGFVFPDRMTDDLFLATTSRVWAISDAGASAAQNWPEVTSVPSPSIPFHPAGTNLLFVGGGDGRLYQIDYTNPAALVVTSAQLGDGGAAVGAPSFDLSSGVVYVGTDAGIIYAVAAPLP